MVSFPPKPRWIVCRVTDRASGNGARKEEGAGQPQVKGQKLKAARNQEPATPDMVVWTRGKQFHTHDWLFEAACAHRDGLRVAARNQ